MSMLPGSWRLLLCPTFLIARRGFSGTVHVVYLCPLRLEFEQVIVVIFLVPSGPSPALGRLLDRDGPGFGGSSLL